MILDGAEFRPSSTTSQRKLRMRPASCQETAWGAPSASNDISNAHWMTWNTGDLEPPGLQTIHARPYPTPEPPTKYGAKGFVSPKFIKRATPKKSTPPPVSRPASQLECVGDASCVVKNGRVSSKFIIGAKILLIVLMYDYLESLYTNHELSKGFDCVCGSCGTLLSTLQPNL